MPPPRNQEELEYVTVRVDQVDKAIESVKSMLPEEEKTCSRCGYEGKAHRWGVKTYETEDANRRALVLCCPACETHTDLPLDIER